MRDRANVALFQPEAGSLQRQMQVRSHWLGFGRDTSSLLVSQAGSAIPSQSYRESPKGKGSRWSSLATGALKEHTAQGSLACEGTEQDLSCVWEMQLCTKTREARKPVEREEQAAKPGHPSPQRLRQDDSCLPIYSQLKSKVNQPGLFHPVQWDSELGVRSIPPIHIQCLHCLL